MHADRERVLHPCTSLKVEENWLHLEKKKKSSVTPSYRTTEHAWGGQFANLFPSVIFHLKVREIAQRYANSIKISTSQICHPVSLLDSLDRDTFFERKMKNASKSMAVNIFMKNIIWTNSFKSKNQAYLQSSITAWHAVKVWGTFENTSPVFYYSAMLPWPSMWSWRKLNGKREEINAN